MKLYKEIENSFPIIEKLFTKETLSEFKNAALSDLCLYNFGLGTFIRNNLLSSDKSILYRLFLKNGMEHTDEMASFIIKLYHYNLSKTTENIK